MRIAPLVLLASITVPLVAQTPAKRTVEFTGLVLVNGFYNSAAVNNLDVPLFTLPDVTGVKAAGAVVRQTRLGLHVDDPNVLGGALGAEIDADFLGEGATQISPTLRLRRALATLSWAHTQLLFGQESPLVSDRNPRSLAAVGWPEFSSAGNLWDWIPQIRFTAEAGYTLRLALQAAVLAPNGGGPGGYLLAPDSAERTGRPYLQGRVRLGWGPTDDPSELAIGGHQGWLRGLDSLTGDSILVSRALTADTRIKIGAAEILAEAYVGKGLAGLGGGGIGQNIGTGGAPIRDKGGWAQLNVKTAPWWMLGGGCGIDDPDDADVPSGGRLKNIVCEGHVEVRPEGGLVFAFTFRRLDTFYSSGDYVVNHLNLAAGYAF